MKSLRMQGEQRNPKRKRGQAAPLFPIDVDRLLNCPDIMITLSQIVLATTE
ncbi:hypothetical protein V6259_19030 [Marinomonas sp. TI.3.20]|uniref:hypothetical protein n=1 Tax=Marinomonas sp. TI.3.20 TaxID=3121296 RepID=UPI00312049BE